MKKIVSVLILMTIFISVFQNIVLGITKLEYADLKKGNTLSTGVQFFEDKLWYTIEANYVYYEKRGEEYPAYCVSHRKRWSRRSRKLSSKH